MAPPGIAQPSLQVDAICIRVFEPGANSLLSFSEGSLEQILCLAGDPVQEVFRRFIVVVLAFCPARQVRGAPPARKLPHKCSAVSCRVANGPQQASRSNGAEVSVSAA